MSAGQLRSGWLAAIGILVMGHCAAWASTARATVGFVLEVQGEWVLEAPGGGSQVGPGVILPAGGVLHARSDPAKVVVAFFDGGRASCSSSVRGCTRLELRILTPMDRGLLARIEKAVRQFFAAPEERYVPVLSRNPAVLCEAVVECSRSTVDLRPALCTQQAGTFDFLLQRKTADRGKVEWGLGQRVKIELQEGRPATFATSCEPGLYQLIQLDRKGYPMGAEAWVLIEDRADYRKSAKSFQTFERMLASWSIDDSYQILAKGQRRAFLEALSEENETRE